MDPEKERIKKAIWERIEREQIKTKYGVAPVGVKDAVDILIDEIADAHAEIEDLTQQVSDMNKTLDEVYHEVQRLKDER